jgi:hypothetical protein
MDSKLYIEWREKLGKWVVEYRGDIISRHDTKAEALRWKRLHYPDHGHESERVQVRENSPRGVKRGEWM